MEWLDEPEHHDYRAAADYLDLIAEPHAVTATVALLRGAQQSTRKAKDILRASQLELLRRDNPHVRADLDKVKQRKKLSPILLVRGHGVLYIADGYHRVCAAYLTDENTEIPCRLVSWRFG